MKNPILSQKPKEDEQDNEPKPNPLLVGCENLLESGNPEDLSDFVEKFDQKIKELNSYYYCSKSQFQKDLLKFDA